MVWPIIFGLVAVLIITLAVVVAWRHARDKISQSRREPCTIDVEAYFAVAPLTKSEQAFHKFLKTCLPHQTLFAHVAVGKMVRTKWWASDFHHQRIADLSVDFLICRPDNTIIAAIELGDASRDTPEYRHRAAKLEALMQAVGVPMIRWDVRRPPGSLEVRKIIEEISNL
ncbi:DUF2726 domain-containing protein [Pandoraea bronchicola]|uniref:DUF2726 domain-containing protein n=1 Tax=Pandoraea bronchicola TaxID=2508287 RepID=A0A5E5BSD0_9BURK|nr:DUF2726 domain-containing protein [Pandoraea bronchicola]VVE88042.1 hypothetical protein PBR20603_01986 [Pandoraea bronchicola]